MTNRCEYLINRTGDWNHSIVMCEGGEEQCPKNRLKCHVSQACWQVRKGLDAVLDGGE